MNTHENDGAEQTEQQLSDQTRLMALVQEIRQLAAAPLENQTPETPLWIQWRDEIDRGALNEPHGEAWRKAIDEATDELWMRQQAAPGEELTADQRLDRQEILKSWEYRATALPLHLAIQLKPYYLPEGSTPEAWRTFQSETGSDAYAVFLTRAPTMEGADNPASQAKLQELNEWLEQDAERRDFIFPRAVEALGACQNRLALALDIIENDRVNFEIAKLQSIAEILDKGVTELFYRHTLKMVGSLHSAEKNLLAETTEAHMAYLTKVGHEILGIKTAPAKRSHAGFFTLEEIDRDAAVEVVKALEEGNKDRAIEELLPLMTIIAHEVCEIFETGNVENGMAILQTLTRELGPNVWKEIGSQPEAIDISRTFQAFSSVIKDHGQKAIHKAIEKNDEIGALRILQSLLNDFGPRAIDILRNDEKREFYGLGELMDQAIEKHQRDHGDQLSLLTAAEFLSSKINRWGDKLMEQFPEKFRPFQEEEKEVMALLEKVNQELKSLEDSPEMPRPPKNPEAPPVLTDEMEQDEGEMKKYHEQRERSIKALTEYPTKLEAYQEDFKAWEESSGYLGKATERENLFQQQQSLRKKIENLKVELTQEYLNFRIEVKNRIPTSWFGAPPPYELKPLDSPLLKIVIAPERQEKLYADLRKIEMGLLSEASKKERRLTVKIGKDEASTEQARQHWFRAQLVAVAVKASRKENDGGYNPSPADYAILVSKMIEKFGSMPDSEIKELFSPVKVLDEKTPTLLLGGARPIKTNEKTGRTLVLIALEGKRKPEFAEVPTRELLSAIQAKDNNKHEELILGAVIPGGVTVNWKENNNQQRGHQR